MPETSSLVAYLLLAACAYLIGSIPTGAIVARLYRNVDLTQLGSERTGATNVSRTMGVGAGIIVLLGDLAKGGLAVWLALHLMGTPTALGGAWLLAVLGHTKSVFLHWRGGRGVGTGLGGLAVAAPGLFVLAALSGAGIAAISRYVSLGSIAGSAVAMAGGIVGYATGAVPLELLPFLILTPGVILWAHLDSMARLLAGAERRLGDRTPTP